MTEQGEANDRFRANWDRAFGEDAQRSPADLSEVSQAPKQTPNHAIAPLSSGSTNGPGFRASSLPADSAEFRTKPTGVRHKGPSPWLELGVQVVLCVATIGAFVAAAIYAHVAQQQKDAMDGQSRTMESQLRTMDKTFGEMRNQSRIAAGSAKASENANRLAREAINRTDKEARKSLDASISSVRLDERAWVSVEIKADNMNFGTEASGFISGGPVGITLRNTGKTPALSVTGGDCFWERAEPAGIPDYETAITAAQQNRFGPDFWPICQDFVKGVVSGENGVPNPIWAIEPVNSIIPPTGAQDIRIAGVFKAPIQTTTTGYPPGFEAARNQGLPPMHYSHMVTVYVLGNILYRDVFDGTPQRFTRFCFMNHGAVFKGCPTGNSMQ